MDHVNIFTSFLAGLLMFLAPCTLPLVPGFIAFIAHNEREKIIKNALIFCFGFLITFLFFGVLAGLLGHILSPIKPLVQKVGAVIIIIFGFYVLGIFRLPYFQVNFGNIFKDLYKTKFSAFFFGVSIALGWSPCVGPVLAGIFFYATFAFSIFKALYLFLFFGLGFILPFLFIAKLLKNGKKFNLKSSKWFSVIAGLLLIFIGILLFADSFNSLAAFFYKLLNFINYESLNKFL